MRGEFTYLVPRQLAGKLLPGQRVRVPFGRGTALGFYLGPAAESAGKSVRLKPIERELEDEPSLPADLVALLRFAAEHYRYPLGEAIRAALPPGLSGKEEQDAIAPEVEVVAHALPGAESAHLRNAPAQAAALSYLIAVGGSAMLTEVVHAIPGARESLRKLEDRKLVRLERREVQPSVAADWDQARPGHLTQQQQLAVAKICSSIDSRGYSSFLLHGVTGSGKTEVYLRAVEHALIASRGGLILVPEIALTPQLVGRFRSRFGAQVAVLHSGLGDRERLRHWQALRGGRLRIAVGVRSAVFAPVADLGIIVVDEEHDPSFKQEEKLRYNARDLAVARAQQLNATVVLGSATPSLESLENAARGRYRKLELPTRVDDRPLPLVSLVDLRLERPRQPAPLSEPPILSPPLFGAIDEVLARGQQAILFLNRRGHSPFLVCEVCGASVRCARCDVCLTHHLNPPGVVCHYCGFASAVPSRCDNCNGPLLRLGVGTERVEAEVASRFPRARVARLDRDSASSARKLNWLLTSFARREIDVLLGTQMIAKGHDFPGVTLVCVLLADSSLAFPDFRAAERTFQLLTQVGGRAGRGADPGRVLVQTYNPDAEALQRVLVHDFEGFAWAELKWRKAMAYPPFSRLVALRVEGINPEQTRAKALELAKRVARKLPPPSWGVRLLGPAPAPIRKLKGKTRWQMLLKGPTHAALAGPVCAAEAFLEELPGSVKVAIDVDPMGML